MLKNYKKLYEESLVKIDELKQSLDYERNLHGILEKLSDKISFSDISSSSYLNTNFTIPDNVAVYVDDLFGGKVLKQEGVVAIHIDKDGNVKTGLTKKEPSKGYIYRLEQEQNDKLA